MDEEKYAEEAMSKIDNHKIFKGVLRTIDHVDILGLEEAFECKRRYTTVKCISNTAELYKISIIV